MDRTAIYIKGKRLEKNLSQSAVAKILGLGCSQFVSNIENGRASLPMTYVNTLKKPLDLDIKYFEKIALLDYRDKMRKQIKEH